MKSELSHVFTIISAVTLVVGIWYIIFIAPFDFEKQIKQDNEKA